jgi:hypothetical protein
MSSTYRNDTAQAVTEAKQWAADSATRTLDAYVDMVEHSQNGTYTADQMAKDAAKLSIGMQQDAARMFTTWSRLLTGLAK